MKRKLISLLLILSILAIYVPTSVVAADKADETNIEEEIARIDEILDHVSSQAQSDEYTESYGSASSYTTDSAQTSGMYLAHLLYNKPDQKIVTTTTSDGYEYKTLMMLDQDNGYNWILFGFFMLQNDEEVASVVIPYDYTTGRISENTISGGSASCYVDLMIATINMTSFTANTKLSFQYQAESGYEYAVYLARSDLDEMFNAVLQAGFRSWDKMLNANTVGMNMNNLGFTAYDSHTYTDPTPAHVWDDGVITKAATCTTNGVKTFTCTFCGANKTESVSGSHNWNAGVITTPATCINDGVKTYACTSCGLTKTETIKASGHSWDNGKLTTPMSDDQDGVVTYTCKSCGLTQTKTLMAGGSTFVDVQDNTRYFYQPVLWATDVGVTNGTSDFTFSPYLNCTRAQVLTFLYRAAGEPQVSGSNPFSDVNSNAYYYDAVLWGVEKGITRGTSPTTFSPNSKVTRAQFITFLWRYAGQPEVEDTASPFVDVQNSSEYYYDAVLWGAEKGITNGTDPTHFSPNASCIRAQVVTFMYRYLGQ